MSKVASGCVVEVIGHPVPASISAAWEALAADSLEANPFLSPGYLQPLAQHYAREAEWRLALVWQDSARTRLLGMAPVALARTGRGPARMVVPLVHRLLPLGHPLLSADPEEARRALDALVLHLGDGLAFDLAGIPRGGPTSQLLGALCEARGWVHDTIKDAPLTHGLHLRAVPAMRAEGRLWVMTTPADIRDGVEQLLALSPERKGADATSFTFLRAMSRTMAQREGLVLAGLETAVGHVGVMALRQGTQAWLWRMDGTLMSDPASQALVCAAIGRATGAPPYALVKPRLTGLGCAPLVTQSWSIIKARHRPAGRSMMLTARRMAASIF